MLISFSWNIRIHFDICIEESHRPIEKELLCTLSKSGRTKMDMNVIWGISFYYVGKLDRIV